MSTKRDSVMSDEEGDSKVSLVKAPHGLPGLHKYMVVGPIKMHFYSTRAAQIAQKQNDMIVKHVGHFTNVIREGTQKYIGRMTP